MKNKKIFLLKTPKTGGSTFAGILRRIADNYQLQTISEVNVLVYKTLEEIEHSIIAQNITIDQIDVLCNHMQYNSTLIEQILGPNYFRVGLIRETVSRALSGYYHSRNFNSFCPELSLKDWPNNCHHFHNGLAAWFVDRSKGPRSFLKNVKEFDHIILSDRFTESLLVFMHKMNLKLTDLLYVQAKKTTSKKKKKEMTPNESKQFEKTILGKNTYDVQMYQHANRTLTKEYNSLPNYYSQMKEIFEEMLLDVQKVCSTVEDFRDCYWGDNGCAKTCIKNWIHDNVKCPE